MNNLFSDIFGIIFILVFYIPINITVMFVMAIIFNVINRSLRLQFPPVVVAIVSAVFVFVIMIALIGGSSKFGQLDFSDIQALFYIATFIINTLVVIIMLSASGIKKMIFKSQEATSFVFGKPQKMATVIYVVAIVFCGLSPLISQGTAYMSEIKSEKELQKLKEMVDNNDIDAFAKENKKPGLWERAVPGEQNSLLEYTVAHNRPEMVHLLLNGNLQLFTYSFDWDVQSPEMVQTLIWDGMDTNKVVEVLTKHNKTELVKSTVEKFKPSFDTCVAYITLNVLENNNTELLDYLIQKGLTKQVQQTSEAISFFISKNDFDRVELLVNKGFAIDTADTRMVYYAVYYDNLPMLKFLFTYPFNVDIMSDEYTNVENAIVGNKKEIFDYLLTLRPDVTTLHTTKLNGETNALRIAERYKQTEMLKMLQQYVEKKLRHSK